MSVESRILDFNYSWQTATTITATSSDANFPSTNLKNFIRGKTWRSSGYFVVDSSNNKINFDEGGSELTATITSGSYTSSALATEIKTQLDAEGSDTYTVTFSSTTGKWTIASDGSTLNLLTNTGTDSANSLYSDIGFATASDHTGAVTYTAENIAIHTEEAVVFDLGTIEAIDSVAFLLDPIGGNKFSDAAVITLQANATDSWSSPAVSQTLTIDSTYDVATHFFSSDQSYRYWRIKVVDPTNPYLYVEIGKVFLANATVLTKAVENGFVFRLQDQSKVTSNDFGHEYYDVYPNRRGFEFTYNNMDDSDLETLDTIYNRVGSVTPICFALDVNAQLFDKDRFFIFGRFSNQFSSTHIIRDLFNKQFVITEAM